MSRSAGAGGGRVRAALRPDERPGLPAASHPAMRSPRARSADAPMEAEGRDPTSGPARAPPCDRAGRARRRGPIGAACGAGRVGHGRRIGTRRHDPPQARLGRVHRASGPSRPSAVRRSSVGRTVARGVAAGRACRRGRGGRAALSGRARTTGARVRPAGAAPSGTREPRVAGALASGPPRPPRVARRHPASRPTPCPDPRAGAPDERGRRSGGGVLGENLRCRRGARRAAGTASGVVGRLPAPPTARRRPASRGWRAHDAARRRHRIASRWPLARPGGSAPGPIGSSGPDHAVWLPATPPAVRGRGVTARGGVDRAFRSGPPSRDGAPRGAATTGEAGWGR